MAIDAKLTTEEVIKELAQIAGRPTEDEDDKEKVADEDDGECGILLERNKQLLSLLIKDVFLKDQGNFHIKNPIWPGGGGTRL